MLERSFPLAEVWSVAAEDALPRLGSDALFIDHEESETREMHPGSAVVLRGSEMLFVEFVDLVYGAAEERRGPRPTKVGLDFRKRVVRIVGGDFNAW